MKLWWLLVRKNPFKRLFLMREIIDKDFMLMVIQGPKGANKEQNE